MELTRQDLLDFGRWIFNIRVTSDVAPFHHEHHGIGKTRTGPDGLGLRAIDELLCPRENAGLGLNILAPLFQGIGLKSHIRQTYTLSVEESRDPHIRMWPKFREKQKSWRQDDIESFGPNAIPNVPKQEIEEGYNVAEIFRAAYMRSHRWRWWSGYWREAISEFVTRANNLRKMSKSQSLKMPPHEYFTATNRACWRSLQHSVKLWHGLISGLILQDKYHS